MNTKMFGQLAALGQDVLLSIGRAAKGSPVDDDFLDWLLTTDGKIALEEASKVAYESLKSDYEAWKQKQNKSKPTSSDFLRLISLGETIIIGETGGKQTIAQAGDFFTGGIDSKFKDWGLDVAGESKPATPVQVHELIKDGRFDQFFPTLGKLNDLCLEQDQIIKFCRDHKNRLRTEGWGTFFLFKKDNQFFVTYVDVNDRGHLYVNVRRFSRSLVWGAGVRRRLVVPKLCQSGS